MLECPKCQRDLPIGTRFCGNCGTPLTDAVPTVTSKNRGYMEPLAGGQHTPDGPQQDSPEETLVFRKSEGGSRQAQLTTLSGDARQQATGLASAEVDEDTVSITRSAFRPNGSTVSTTPGASISSVASAPPAMQVAPVSSSASSSASFAIPARPGRSPGGSATPGQPQEGSGEATTLVPLAQARTGDTGGRAVLAVSPGDSLIVPADCGSFAAIASKMPIDLPASPVPVTPATGAKHTTRPLEEVSVSTAGLAVQPQVPAVSSPVPVVEYLAEPSFSITNIKLALQVTSAVPTTPTTLETLIDGIEADELDEVDVSAIPTVPAGDSAPEGSDIDPVAFFAPFLKPTEAPAHLCPPADPYLYLKQELTAQRMEIAATMDELLPLVYDNHRDENQALFAHILTTRPPLDDEAWGHAAFVLGAYGNYMYRNPLTFTKKLEIWRAQLWAVYYERSYRRKYLAQRCQQLIHFFQGCAENPIFCVIALHDLETLYFYLEPGSLRKLRQMLQELPIPPTDLLQRVDEWMVVAEEEKAERMARQPAPSQPKGLPASQPPGKLIPSNTNRPASHSTPPHIHKATSQSAQQHAAEEIALAIPPQARKWLGFLSEEQQRQFFLSLRSDRLESIRQILLEERKQILMVLRTELLNAGSLEYQRPRKSVPVRQTGRNSTNHNRFAEAFKLLSSSKPREQQIALRMFEQNARENIKQEDEQGAREWMLYARTLLQGGTRVAPDWERALKKEEASWEEIWNLAYYHRMAGDLVEAVRVLTPGLNELDAPITHLRLALICALTLVLEPRQAGSSAQQSAHDLLISHLERWPHPLSCLAWLVLTSEHPGTLRPLDQSRRLSVFQELLEDPVDLPDPRFDLAEPLLNALEHALVSKTHCDEAWFLWLNDYANRRPHHFLAWQRLAETSERMNRLERAELALQHSAGIYYDLDYVYVQEGEEGQQATEELRQHVERLFDFYRRHNLHQQARDSFESCYATLNHLGFWNEQEPANRKLLLLVGPFLTEFRRQQAQREQAQRLADVQEAKSRSEIRRRELSNNPTKPLEHFKSGRRVGIFVDYENIARFIPHEEDTEQVGQALVSYAAQFGEVVCRWASASPRNLPNLTAVRTGLEAAQFQIRYPRRELQFSPSQKDLADYALLECINNASLNDRLDVYLVVSGDRDYYERIYSLLENGRTVRILARESNLSASYHELEQQRQRKHKAAGDEESDFFIDNLDEVLSPELP